MRLVRVAEKLGERGLAWSISLSASKYAPFVKRLFEGMGNRDRGSHECRWLREVPGVVAAEVACLMVYGDERALSISHVSKDITIWKQMARS